MVDKINVHPLTAPGPMLTCGAECIQCHAPVAEAPDLMGVDKNGNCYFRKQPQTESEWRSAASTSIVSCINGIYCDDSNASIAATGKTFDELIAEQLSRSQWTLTQNKCDACTLQKFLSKDELICIHCRWGYSTEITKKVIEYSPPSDLFVQERPNLRYVNRFVKLMKRWWSLFKE